MLGNVFLPLLIAVVIIMIFDLAYPQRGVIGISQQTLFDLQKAIQTGNP